MNDGYIKKKTFFSVNSYHKSLAYSGLKRRNLSFQHDNDTMHKSMNDTNSIYDNSATVLQV